MDNRVPEQRGEDSAQEIHDLENLGISGRNCESLKGKEAESLEGAEELQNMDPENKDPGPALTFPFASPLAAL